MEIQYNFKPYDKPRLALYRIETQDYNLADGWATQTKQSTVIGECDGMYVTQLKPTGHAESFGDKLVHFEYILPIGFHKSRLIRWVNKEQLQLAI